MGWSDEDEVGPIGRQIPDKQIRPAPPSPPRPNTDQRGDNEGEMKLNQELEGLKEEVRKLNQKMDSLQAEVAKLNRQPDSSAPRLDVPNVEEDPNRIREEPNRINPLVHLPPSPPRPSTREDLRRLQQQAFTGSRYPTQSNLYYNYPSRGSNLNNQLNSMGYQDYMMAWR